MITKLDCIPCFVRQALQASRFASESQESQEKVLKEVLMELSKRDWNCSPPELAHIVHAIIRKEAQGMDPYKKVKQDKKGFMIFF